jgi:HEPN domain-containing protein
MNKADLKKLAQMRYEDANVLHAGKRYSGAYYLAGYAVECALKACIAGNVKKGDFPDRETVNKSWSHNLESLVGIAGLGTELKGRIDHDQDFSAN